MLIIIIALRGENGKIITFVDYALPVGSGGVL